MKKSTSIQIFGDMFRQRREMLKRTTKAVACELGVGEQYIIDFEAGKIKSMPISMFYALAWVVYLSADDLILELVLATSKKDFGKCFTRVDIPFG